MIQLDLLSFNTSLKRKTESGIEFIFDPIRKRWLQLLPEEFVRQLFLSYLTEEKLYSAKHIQIEKKILVNNTYRRFDIVIFDANANAKILVECKSYKEKITNRVFEQISAYNLTLKVDYLVVTNGIETHCCEMNYDQKNYQFKSYIPSVRDLK